MTFIGELRRNAKVVVWFPEHSISDNGYNPICSGKVELIEFSEIHLGEKSNIGIFANFAL